MSSATGRDKGATQEPQEENVFLSACLIVKDEEQALPDCCASLHRLVDEVVVYDTGSTDGTVALARRAGARVYEGYWDDDFGRARNAALEHCRGEWALWLDADERFICNNIPALRTALQRLSADGELDALFVDIYNLAGDGSILGGVHRAFRLFKKATCCWYGSLHEQVDLRPALASERVVRAAPLIGARIDHFGYTDAAVRERDKPERNLRLARAELGREPRPGQQGIAEFNLARALAVTGRAEEAQRYFETALGLVRDGLPKRSVLLHILQNLAVLGRHEEVARRAQLLREMSSDTSMADYFEGMALRRLGHNDQAIELLQGVPTLATEDGFAFPEANLHVELAGALVDAGRHEEAFAAVLALVRQHPTVLTMTSALKVLASTSRPPDDLAAAMPADNLDDVGAALVLVPPAVAAPVADALYRRLGPRPQLLAAAIRFAPGLPTLWALEWSHRLRSIGMDSSCPLLAQARIAALEVRDRLRAALTARAAFGDQRGASLAIALAAGVPEAELAGALEDVNALCPALTAPFARAAAQPGAEGAGDVGTPEGRRSRVLSAVLALGDSRLAAQLEKSPDATAEESAPVPQLAGQSADRS